MCIVQQKLLIVTKKEGTVPELPFYFIFKIRTLYSAARATRHRLGGGRRESLSTRYD
jgi:hypothetical protein